MDDEGGSPVASVAAPSDASGGGGQTSAAITRTDVWVSSAYGEVAVWSIGMAVWWRCSWRRG